MTNKQMKSSCCGASLNILVKKSEELPNTVNVYGCSKCGNITDDSCLNPQEEKTNKEKILSIIEKHTNRSINSFIGIKVKYTLNDCISDIEKLISESQEKYKAELREKIEERIKYCNDKVEEYEKKLNSDQYPQELKEVMKLPYASYGHSKNELELLLNSPLLSPDQSDNS